MDYGRGGQSVCTYHEALFMGMGALSKAFYEKYGEEAVPIVTEVMSRGGVGYGEIMQQMATARSMKAVGEMPKMMGIEMETVELSVDTFHFRAPKWLPGIEGTSKELCEATMVSHKKMAGTFLGQEVDMRILKSVAAGDKECEVMFSRR